MFNEMFCNQSSRGGVGSMVNGLGLSARLNLLNKPASNSQQLGQQSTDAVWHVSPVALFVFPCC